MSSGVCTTTVAAWLASSDAAAARAASRSSAASDASGAQIFGAWLLTKIYDGVFANAMDQSVVLADIVCHNQTGIDEQRPFNPRITVLAEVQSYLAINVHTMICNCTLCL